MKLKYLLVLFPLLLCFLVQSSKAQSKIDSLKTQLLITNQDTAVIDIYLDIVNAYTHQNADSAMIFADKALELANKIGRLDIVASINMTLGTMFFNQGNYGRSMEFYFKSLKFYESGDNIIDVVFPYFNIALNYGYIQDDLHAREYYFKAAAIVEELMKVDPEIGSRYFIGRIYNNIGITYHNFEQYDEALIYYNKALLISDALKSDIALPFVYNNIGLVYQAKNDCETALTYYQKSLDLRVKKNDLSGIALTYFYFGECYAKMGNFSKAIQFHNNGYNIATNNNLLELQRNISDALIPLYAAVGNYKGAYEMHLEYKKSSESLNLEESAKMVSMLEQQYRFDKVMSDIELKRQQAVFRNITIGGILFTLMAVFSLLYYAARTKLLKVQLQRENFKLEKEKLSSELEYKNKELTTNVMYLLQKNELINTISTRLLELKRDMLKQNQDPVQRIINELQRSLDDDVWQEFEYRFKDVHEDFYKALNEKFPDLTINERKLCAFLRLNMSTKEISAITFQSLHSITIARSRLRKKLNLTNTDTNISDFLATIQ